MLLGLGAERVATGHVHRPATACTLPPCVLSTILQRACREGRFNAVMFWFKLHLHGDVYLSTGPEAVEQGGCCRPAAFTA